MTTGWPRRIAALALALCISGVLPAGTHAQTVIPPGTQPGNAPGQQTSPPQTSPQQDGDAQFAPPWTQEKQIPKEVADKAKEKPIAWCPKTNGASVIYRNDKTGETTEIEYKNKNGKTTWTITKQKPNEPQTVTKYDLDPNNPSKTVTTDKGKTTTGIPPDDMVAQTPPPSSTPKTASAPQTGGGTTPTTETPKTPTPTTPTPTTPAPTTPTPTTPKQATQSAPTPVKPPTPSVTPSPTTPAPTPTPTQTTSTPIQPPPTPTGSRQLNIKPVTYGGPPPETTITFDPGSPKKPTDVVRTPDQPQTPKIPTGTPTWGPDDPEGPRTGQPGKPGGGPTFTEIPGGGTIHVGFGWAYQTVPSDFFNGCTVDKDDVSSPAAQRAQTQAMAQKKEGGAPQTMARDCAELTAAMNSLLGQLESMYKANLKNQQAAQKAFWGDPKNKFVDGYKAMFTRSEVTKAQVDGSTAAGKMLIDAALFAAGGPGLGMLGKEGAVLSKLNKIFGSGMWGAETATEATTKVAQKVISKVLDEAVGSKAGTAGVATWKTIEKWDDKWWQGGMGAVESIIRGKVLDGIGDWMKEGASAADVAASKQSYADFVANAEGANINAAAAAMVRKQLEDLNEQAKMGGCPQVQIPDYNFYTFDVASYGEGAFDHQQGPMMHRKNLADGTSAGNWDMFARNSTP